MKLCDACGSPKAHILMGGAAICSQCDPDVQAEIKRLHAENKPVNVMHIAKRIFRKTHSSGNYLLRDIPEEIWTKAQHRAVDDKVSLRDLLLQALHAYLA